MHRRQGGGAEVVAVGRGGVVDRGTGGRGPAAQGTSTSTVTGSPQGDPDGTGPESTSSLLHERTQHHDEPVRQDQPPRSSRTA